MRQGDGEGTGGTPADETRTAAPVRPAEPRTLRALYMDLLRRPPLAAEFDRRLGCELEELLDALLGSEEFWRQWLEEELYYFLLVDNFRPATAALEEAPAALAEGELDPREVLHRIALSSSFDLRNPGADTFVTVVMEQICGLTVQKRARELEVGKRIYDGARGSFLGQTGSSQADVVRIAIESEEGSRTFAARQYERYMHAAPGEATLRSWARALHAEPAALVPLLREAILSDAYRERLARSRPVTNRLFVRCLYVDLLDRLPGPDEAEPLREALDGLGDSAPLRSVIVRLFLDSGRVDLPKLTRLPDPRGYVADRFRRMLGREADEAELDAFAAAAADPACRTETVLYAILSHPEYHRY